MPFKGFVTTLRPPRPGGDCVGQKECSNEYVRLEIPFLAVTGAKPNGSRRISLVAAESRLKIGVLLISERLVGDKVQTSVSTAKGLKYGNLADEDFPGGSWRTDH